MIDIMSMILCFVVTIGLITELLRSTLTTQSSGGEEGNEFSLHRNRTHANNQKTWNSGCVRIVIPLNFVDRFHYCMGIAVVRDIDGICLSFNIKYLKELL